MASDGWRETTIGELCDKGGVYIQTGPFGSQLHKHDYVPTGVPVIPTEAIGKRLLKPMDVPQVSPQTADRLSRHRIRAGDILFARRGIQATGLSAIARPEHTDWICGTGAILLRVLDNSTDPEFLSFVLSAESSFDWLRRHAVGAVMPNLNETVIRHFPLRLPPIKTQRGITAVLRSLDDKIELNRRMNGTLERMAAAVFKSWFIDFDPVRAKSEGRDPNLPADLASLFPDSFVDSDLGPIPDGWMIGALSELASLRTKTIQPSKQPLTQWEHYSIPAYDEGQQPRHELGSTIKSGKFAVPEDSVLVSKLNPQFPRIWLPFVHAPARAICSTEFMPFVPRHCTWRPFVFEMMKSQAIQDAIKAHVTGSTGSRQRVKPKDIAGLSMLCPPDSIVTAFSDLVRALHGRLLANRCQNHRLAGLRDTLLPKLLSGEIKVEDEHA